MKLTKGVFISILMLCTFITQAATTGSSYHFIYIDISNTKNLDALHKKLVEIQNQIEYQTFIVYLSNNKKPIITSKPEELEQFFNSIYNISPSEPRLLDFEIENILKQFTQNEFMDTIINNETMLKYEKVYFHFFLDLTSFQNRNLIRRFINPLLMANNIYDNSAISKSIFIYIYFNQVDLNNLTLEERNKLNEENKKLHINEY